jgi:hypothetical protein
MAWLKPRPSKSGMNAVQPKAQIPCGNNNTKYKGTTHLQNPALVHGTTEIEESFIAGAERRGACVVVRHWTGCNYGLSMCSRIGASR